MRNYKDETYYLRIPKKVKHVHFITAFDEGDLERNVNAFADEHPEYKILGIRLNVVNDTHLNCYIATITYLCDVEGEGNPCDYDSDDEED